MRSVSNDPPPLTAEEVALALSPAMRRALWRAQEQLFDGRATVTGHGMTMRAFRARGVVKGAMPYAYLTGFGREVIAKARLRRDEFAPREEGSNRKRALC